MPDYAHTMHIYKTLFLSHKIQKTLNSTFYQKTWKKFLLLDFKDLHIKFSNLYINTSPVYSPV
jgi:hypothetical protein